MSMIERISARCIEDGDCLVWQGHSRGGRHPQIKVDGKVRYVRKVLWEAQNGLVPPGKVLAHTCETRNCVCHVEPQTVSKVQKRVGATGAFSTPQRCAKIAAAKRRDSAKLTLEQALDIRYSDGATKDKAAEYGVGKTVVNAIRRGDSWKEYSNPFAGLV